MSDNAREIVDLVVDDKPNKAGEVLNDTLVDKVADHVQGVKDSISREMFGAEEPSDAEQVEVQPELDFPDPEVEEDGEEYAADQELVDEPDVDELEDTEVEEEESVEEEETDENTQTNSRTKKD